MIAKVTKERKMLQEAQQKTAEDLQVAEDKNNHLTLVSTLEKYFFLMLALLRRASF